MPDLTSTAKKTYSGLTNSYYKNLSPSPMVKNLQNVVSGMKVPSLSKYYSSGYGGVAMPQIDSAQQIADSIANQIKTWNKFTEVLPYNTIVNEDLLRQFGESQGNPEANRLKWTSLYNNLVNQSRAGTLNSGMAERQRYDLGNQLERQRQELVNQFYQAGKANLGNYYNDLYKEYYMDPNAFQYNPVPLANVVQNYTPMGV